MPEMLVEQAVRPEFNQELRVRTDTTTWLAETLHGSMRTSFEFDFDGQELLSEDGGSLDDIFDEAIAEAKIMAEQNPSMLFELRRRIIEREELGDMYKMINGELPNTMVVMSDFPPELTNSSEDVGGYNVNRQQTMMRIITVQPNGKLRITSQSLDGSNRQALEAIYTYLAEPVEEGELLSQRVYRQFSEADQDQLNDSLTKVYDGSLAEQFEGEWHAGISQKPDKNITNTYDFVLAQEDLIEWFVSEKKSNPAGAEKLRYRLAATADARHKRFLKGMNIDQASPGTVSYSFEISPALIVNSRDLQAELVREEKRAASLGNVYSGCGGTVTADGSIGELTGEVQLNQLGYGNTSNSDKYGSRTFKCQNGHTNHRPPNQLIPNCKTCGCSVKC